jgi:hypothetical protein
MVNRQKWQKLGKVVFCVVSGIPDPPPPPVKCRMPRGVQNLIWVVDLDATLGRSNVHDLYFKFRTPPPPSLNSEGEGGSGINLVR